MHRILIFLVSVFWVASCKNLEESRNQQIEFTTRQFPLKSDTTISSIAFYDNKIICLQDNHKILVLDTSYTRQDKLAAELNRFEFIYLFTLHDTVFIGTKNKAYFIDSNFKLTEFKRKTRLYVDPLYEDSKYYVYGCCVGEFGGSVFFLDKTTTRTYSYFATCATQVLKFKNEYVVCNNLAHLGKNMSFLFIPQPAKLYELTDEKLKNHCNWYAEVDTIKNASMEDKNHGVKSYAGPYGTMSLISFPVKDSLYSILCDDSSTFVAVHKGNSTLRRQIIFDKAIYFHESKVVKAGSKLICLYNLTNGSPFAAYTVTGKNSGLIIVDNNNIDIVDRFYKD